VIIIRARPSEDPAEIVSLEHFGAGADHRPIYERFGITADAARRSFSRASE
jgi:transketolase